MFLELHTDNARLKDEQLRDFYNNLLADVRRNALVRSATLTGIVPVSGSYESLDFAPGFGTALGSKERVLYVHRVASNYFHTLGIRLLRGRDFTASDDSSQEQLALVSASAAQALFPKQDPLGQLLRQNAKTSFRIIGVVDDAKYVDLRELPASTIYLSMKGNMFFNLVIRGDLDKSAAVAEVRGVLKQTGKDIRLGEVLSLTEQIDQALRSERLIALLASFFAALAAMLVAVGLYGVVAYSAARRTSEFGLRIALGASRENVRWLVMREALVLSVLGATVGVPAALFGGRVAKSLLYGVEPGDPFILGMTVGLLLMIAFIAGTFPALRASRLDPMFAIRYE